MNGFMSLSVCPGMILAFKWYVHFTFFTPFVNTLGTELSGQLLEPARAGKGQLGGRIGLPWGWAGACLGAKATGSPHICAWSRDRSSPHLSPAPPHSSLWFLDCAQQVANASCLQTRRSSSGRLLRACLGCSSRTGRSRESE